MFDPYRLVIVRDDYTLRLPDGGLLPDPNDHPWCAFRHGKIVAAYKSVADAFRDMAPKGMIATCELLRTNKAIARVIVPDKDGSPCVIFGIGPHIQFLKLSVEE